VVGFHGGQSGVLGTLGVITRDATRSFKNDIRNKHLNSITTFIISLYESKLLSDVSFVLEGDEKSPPITAHKLVLAASSEVFQKQLSSEIRYPIKVPLIKKIESLNNFIKALYTGELDITSDTMDELSILANMYQVSFINALIDRFLRSGLSEQTVIPFFIKYGTGIQYIACHPKVFESKEFLKLTKDKVIELLSSNELLMDEVTIFRAAVDWGKAQLNSSSSTSSSTTSDPESKDKVDIKDLKNVLKDVLLHVRFPLMSQSQLGSVVASSGLLESGDLVRIFTYIAAKGQVGGALPWPTKPRG